MNRHVTAAAPLAAELLDGLARFRRAGVAGTRPHGPHLFSYCALARERLVPVVLPHPVLGIVLGGHKEVWRGDDGQAMPPGTMFVLPARVTLDIWNVPDPAGGCYQSLILEIRPEDVPDVPSPARGPDLRVGLTPALVATAVHAASALADGPALPAVRTARIRELVALLSADPAAAPLFDRSTAGRIGRLVAGDLAFPWTAPAVAARLAMSESTLRRRLAAEGTGLAALLRAERMQAARALIGGGAGSRAAAIAVGYASRAHFARAYRAAFGENPRPR